MTTYWITLAILCAVIGIIWGIRKYKKTNEEKKNEQ